MVQQKQGRVKPTAQLKPGVNINDDSTLEKEADVMGAKSLQMESRYTLNNPAFSTYVPNTVDPIQRKILVNGSPYVPDSDEDVSPQVEEVIGDEFLRYYKSEGEAKDHIDNKVPGEVGLIKSRALWYRIPYLNDSLPYTFKGTI